MTVEEIAKICHEANRAYCETLHDFSQSPWEQAPDWQKRSAINGVEFHHANRVGPRESHENWLKVKLAEGWQWGAVKDPDLKLHPCCVPYDMLPEDQRRKDAIFAAIVQACTTEVPA